jgi:hypothetical protein
MSSSPIAGVVRARRRSVTRLGGLTVVALVSAFVCLGVDSPAQGVTGTVIAFRSPDRRVECADEPADAIGLHPGINCFAGRPRRGCDGEVIALTGVGPYGRAFGVRRGCAGATPLDYGE